MQSTTFSRLGDCLFSKMQTASAAKTISTKFDFIPACFSNFHGKIFLLELIKLIKLLLQTNVGFSKIKVKSSTFAKTATKQERRGCMCRQRRSQFALLFHKVPKQCSHTFFAVMLHFPEQQANILGPKISHIKFHVIKTLGGMWQTFCSHEIF